LPAPPRSSVNPLTWDLGPADALEFYLTRLPPNAWKEIYLSERLFESDPSHKLPLINGWDKEIFGE
jgi:hypothetical protein